MTSKNFISHYVCTRLISGLLCAILLAACNQHRTTVDMHSASTEVIVGETGEDASLQRAAIDALGGREGTVMVMDARNGRLRAVVNPRLAFEQSFPPGSAIKPFTALAVLRAGLMTTDTRVRCRGRYEHDGVEIACSHPISHGTFTLAQALAYSCNYYFATLGERLGESAFNATMLSFGFGTRTGVNAMESTGKVPHGIWEVREALGESEGLLVTPVQLLTAYVALCNGGHLYQPHQADDKYFTVQERATITLPPTYRTTLLEGMHGAVRYGTAARAGLSRLPIDIFGKTGTSSSSNGFRTQGWFIGFGADRGTGGNAMASSARLAVLVFLKRAHGAECAEVSRTIFEKFSKFPHRNTERAESANIPLSMSGGHSNNTEIIHVRLVSCGSTVALPLEDYVRGVLAAESSVEYQIEALKAQAVISRTFALKNLRRHADEGVDFCSTTHCQRYVSPVVRRGSVQIDPMIQRAVMETVGEVLRDSHGELVDVYYHAACGGMTADANALWGMNAPSYLHGVRDEYCAAMPHRNWTATISATQLAAALRSDPSSNVGKKLNDAVITEHDATGRAAVITLEGERRRVVRGWNFKLIVGRALGWNLLKSSRFEIHRSGTDFVFRGSGFGHGVGFCQEGAHVMAQRGIGYRQIAEHYFPGTGVAFIPARAHALDHHNNNAAAEIIRTVSNVRIASAPSVNSAELSSGTPRAEISGEYFRVTYPAAVAKSEATSVMRTLETVRIDVQRRLKSAAIAFPELGSIEIVVHNSTQEFAQVTGNPVWTAARTRRQRIELQPLGTLRRRGVLITTLRHEYVHTIIESLGHGHAPHWLAEGLAAYIAGESQMLSPFEPKKRIAMDELERKLSQPASSEEMRMLYASACREIRESIQTAGEASLWKQVSQ